jgi:phosphoribosylformylglycinamidine cyclo-ligase
VTRYADVGVDLDEVAKLHGIIRNLMSPEKTITVLGPGHYAGVIRLDDIYLGLHTDGVGTKVQLGLSYGITEPLGIDCVAMNVNDLISLGLKPLALVDYIAMESPMEEPLDGIIRGLKAGAAESDVDIVGGETAIMPGVIKGMDLSCSALGASKVLKTGRDVRPGDIIIGLESNGIHSNGFTLVRKLLESGALKEDPKVLLKPTSIYVKPVSEVLSLIKAAAHITGGSFSKLRRITTYKIEMAIENTQDIFLRLEEAGVPHDEMYRVFNMGIGMILFLSKENAEEVLSITGKYVRSNILGQVNQGTGIVVRTHKNVILDL